MKSGKQSTSEIDSRSNPSKESIFVSSANNFDRFQVIIKNSKQISNPKLHWMIAPSIMGINIKTISPKILTFWNFDQNKRVKLVLNTKVSKRFRFNGSYSEMNVWIGIELGPNTSLENEFLFLKYGEWILDGYFWVNMDNFRCTSKRSELLSRNFEFSAENP